MQLKKSSITEYCSPPEAAALPNLAQTFRGRERSKRGYAVDLRYCSDL